MRLCSLGLALLFSVAAVPAHAGDLAAAYAAVPFNGPTTVDAATATSLGPTKLHDQLRLAAQSGDVSGLPPALRDADRVLVEIRYVDAKDELQRAQNRDAVTSTLERLGATTRNRLGDAAVEAWVPTKQLEALAAHAEVARILPARLARRLIGNATSQGVAAGRADWWQAATYTGTGIRIAMVDGYDSSANKIFSLQSSNDWPPSARLTQVNQKATGSFGSNGEPHGNATLEIAYDVAPGATFRAYDTVTVGDWYNAILDAANVNTSGSSLGAIKANVVSASLGAPLDGIGDGSAQAGSIAQAAGFARARGVVVVNAAGNERQQHWGGGYTSSSGNAALNTFSGSNTQIDYFGPSSTQVYCITAGEVIQVELYWNDWSSVNKDYDLILYRYNGTSGDQVATSTFVQSGNTSTQTPQEFIQFTASGSAAPCGTGAAYGVAIKRNTAGASNNMQLFTSIPLEYPVAARSLGFPADSANVVSVAAIDQSSSNQEVYSSEGPVLASGGGIPFSPDPTTDSNLKPDVSSFANVNTVSYGAGVFNGTSSATPHVAGMIALLMQRYGVAANATDVDTLKTTLRNISSTGSNDRGTTGRDYQYGAGRVRFQKETALAFDTQPSTAQVGNVIAPNIKVGVRDDENILVTFGIFSSIGLSFGTDPSGGTATLAGNSAALVNGQALFNAASINKAGTAYTLRASAGSLAQPTSNSFNITGAPATKLVFLQQPGNVAAGTAIAPALKVQVQDATGTPVTTSTATVTLAIATNPGSSTLGGTLSANAVAGVATFANVTLNKIGTGYTLRASSTGLAGITSNAFNVTTGAAAKLAFVQPPTSAVAGATLTPAVTVQVLDAGGNPVSASTATVTLAIGSNPGGSSLNGTTGVAAVSGVASFNTLSLNKAGGGYTLAASASGLTGATSTSFDISAAAAAKLVFLQQPGNTVAGAAITPAPIVQVQDSYGNAVGSSTASIAISIGTNPGASSLAGTTTRSVSGGFVSFDNLSLGKTGSGYTLNVASTGLTGATSNAFDITPGAAAKLGFVQQPADGMVGLAIAPAVVVEVEDANANRVASTATITIAVANNPGAGTLSGTTAKAATAGAASFDTLALNQPGSGYTLSASASGLTAATSSAFNILPAAPRLLFLQAPADLASGTHLGQIQVAVQDAAGHTVTTDSSTVVSLSTSVCGSPASIAPTATAQNGIATFAANVSLPFYTVATGKALSASASGFADARSANFAVTLNADLAFADGFDGCRL